MLFTFFESSKIFLINILPVLIMSAKLDSLGLLKIKVFQNSGYDSQFLTIMSPTKF